MLEPIARTGAASRRLWKETTDVGVCETYPIEAPVLTTRGHITKPCRWILCRITVKAHPVYNKMLGRGYRFQVSTVLLDPDSREPERVIGEQWSEDSWSYLSTCLSRARRAGKHKYNDLMSGSVPLRKVLEWERKRDAEIRI